MEVKQAKREWISRLGAQREEREELASELREFAAAVFAKGSEVARARQLASLSEKATAVVDDDVSASSYEEDVLRAARPAMLGDVPSATAQQARGATQRAAGDAAGTSASASVSASMVESTWASTAAAAAATSAAPEAPLRPSSRIKMWRAPSASDVREAVGASGGVVGAATTQAAGASYLEAHPAWRAPGARARVGGAADGCGTRADASAVARYVAAAATAHAIRQLQRSRHGDGERREAAVAASDVAYARRAVGRMPLPTARQVAHGAMATGASPALYNSAHRVMQGHAEAKAGGFVDASGPSWALPARLRRQGGGGGGGGCGDGPPSALSSAHPGSALAAERAGFSLPPPAALGEAWVAGGRTAASTRRSVGGVA